MTKSTYFTLFFGVLLGALDISILGPAIPAIRQEFGLDPRLSSWLITLYVLANLVGTPILGKLSDRFGRRSLYTLSLGCFGVGSCLVAAAPSYPWLLVGRALQGFGSGGIFPVASAVIGELVPADRRGRALGGIGATFGLAFLFGPPLGALLLHVTTWRWIFGIQVPMALLLIVLASRQIPQTRTATPKPFDWLGIFLLAGALGGLSWSLASMDTQNLGLWLARPLTLAAIVLGFGCLFALLRDQRSHPDPILSPELLRRPRVQRALLLGASAGLGEVGVMLLPDLAVHTLGISHAGAGMLLFPLVLGMTLAAPVAGRLLDRYGAGRIVSVGVVLHGVGLGMFGVIPLSVSLYWLAGPLLGIGMACLLAGPLRWVMLQATLAEERAMAQGLLSSSHAVGQIIVSSLMGAVAGSGVGAHGSRTAYVVAGVAALAFLPACWKLDSND